ncbi:hypothetical protein pb186bvf_008105 [Paramecium bursaria]
MLDQRANKIKVQYLRKLSNEITIFDHSQLFTISTFFAIISLFFGYDRQVTLSYFFWTFNRLCNSFGALKLRIKKIHKYSFSEAISDHIMYVGIPFIYEIPNQIELAVLICINSYVNFYSPIFQDKCLIDHTIIAFVYYTFFYLPLTQEYLFPVFQYALFISIIVGALRGLRNKKQI